MSAKKKTAHQRLLEIVQDGALHSSSDLERDGVHRVAIKQAVDDGEIQQFSRGIYASLDFEPSGTVMWEHISKQIPGAICLGSAAVHHALGDEAPPELWYAVDRTKVGRSGLAGYDGRVKFVFCQPKSLAIGIEVHNLNGTPVSFTSPARTVVDFFRYRKDWGMDSFEKVLTDYIRSGRDIEELLEIGRQFYRGRTFLVFMERVQELSAAFPSPGQIR